MNIFASKEQAPRGVLDGVRRGGDFSFSRKTNLPRGDGPSPVVWSKKKKKGRGLKPVFSTVLCTGIQQAPLYKFPYSVVQISVYIR